jgi:hypothetical protein
VKTLLLPISREDGMDLDFVPKGETRELEDFSESTRKMGYLPVLRVAWDYYDERSDQLPTLGTGDGQRPSLADLLVIICAPSGRLRVQAGPGAGWFRVDRVTPKPIGVAPNGLPKGVELVFHGKDILPTMALGT